MNKYRPSLGVSSTSQFTGKKPGVTSMTSLFTHICSKYIWESSVYLHSLLISSPFSGLFLEESKMSEKWCGTFYTTAGAAVVALGSKWNLLLE